MNDVHVLRLAWNKFVSYMVHLQTLHYASSKAGQQGKAERLCQEVQVLVFHQQYDSVLQAVRLIVSFERKSEDKS